MIKKLLDLVPVTVSVFGVVYILGNNPSDLAVRFGLFYLLAYIPVHLGVFWWHKREG
jgi:hypothetical protein